MWCSSSQVMTPTWASPSAPPPWSTRPTVERFDLGGCSCAAAETREEMRTMLMNNNLRRRYILILQSSKKISDRTRHPETGHWTPWPPESVRRSRFAGPKDRRSAHPERGSSCSCARPELYCSTFACCRTHCRSEERRLGKE